MKKMFIAIAPKGAEFIYKRSSAIATPAKSAAAIAEALTKSNYKLKPGETWHAYENDSYTNDFISLEIRSYSPGKNIKLYKYNG